MEQRLFEITVAGQYYGANETTGVATTKNYTARFTLPSQEAALSIICKHLLTPYLKKNYPDFARFRTHKIVSIIVKGRQPSKGVLQMAFEDMTVAELSDFCILRQILIDPSKHSNLDKVREEVRKIWENRIAQQKQDQKTGKAKENIEVADLLALNKLEADENPEISNGAQRIAAANRKGRDVRLDLPVEPASVSAPTDEETVPPADEGDLLG